MKRTILIVDDDRAVADSLKKMLETENFNILVAVDGPGAIGLFGDNLVDLVVLDINLGSDNGWEVFRRMQEIKPYVPTIVVTAEYGQHEQAIAAGAEALVEKPIDVSSFLDLIWDLLTHAPQPMLQRAHHDPKYCRYFGKDQATFLRLLQERRSAPLDLSSEMSAALPGRSATRARVHNFQTVVGDPTTTGVQ